MGSWAVKGCSGAFTVETTLSWSTRAPSYVPLSWIGLPDCPGLWHGIEKQFQAYFQRTKCSHLPVNHYHRHKYPVCRDLLLERRAVWFLFSWIIGSRLWNDRPICSIFTLPVHHLGLWLIYLSDRRREVPQQEEYWVLCLLGRQPFASQLPWLCWSKKGIQDQDAKEPAVFGHWPGTGRFAIAAEILGVQVWGFFPWVAPTASTGAHRNQPGLRRIHWLKVQRIHAFPRL